MVNQFTVIEGRLNRRSDAVLFLNGFRLVVTELTVPGDENATIEGTFNQFRARKDETPSWFRTSGAFMTSDGKMRRSPKRHHCSAPGPQHVVVGLVVEHA